MILLLMIVIGAELVSIAIYAVMYTQNAFKEVLPEWDKYGDDRSISLFIMRCNLLWMVVCTIFCMDVAQMDQERK